MLSGTKANIAIKLFGEDLNRMYALATQIGRSIAGVEGIADIAWNNRWSVRSSK